MADLRGELLDAWRAGVAAVEPARCVLEAVEVADGTVVARGSVVARPRRVVVVAFGKAAPAMARGLAEGLDGLPSTGVVVAPEATAGPWPSIVAGHPVPDAGSVLAGRRVLELAAAAGPDDLLVCCISGGGSALVEVPAEGLELGDLVATTELLLGAGAPIDELNAVRKHLSAVKGGRLAEAARRTTLLTLVLSDVVGDPLDVIASGPTVPDPTTYRDALDVVDRHGLRDRLPGRVVAHLEAGASGLLPETPKRPHPRQTIEVVGNGPRAARAAVERLRRRGITARVVETTLAGEARDVGARVAVARLEVAVGVYAGETTVTVRGDGRGGRNQEAALAAALALEGTDGIFLAAGTDGIDGPTDAAGALVDGGTIARGRAAGLDPYEHLARNDAYAFLAAAGDLVVTGPTGTNVADLWLARPPRPRIR
ncbi:MAG TPA: DUF4147 domain-containing protein [Actinobacteria bacterium]|nr:DUF4147 domain-containing protein [Actinomycetota bacterium]